MTLTRFFITKSIRHGTGASINRRNIKAHGGRFRTIQNEAKRATIQAYLRPNSGGIVINALVMENRLLTTLRLVPAPIGNLARLSFPPRPVRWREQSFYEQAFTNKGGLMNLAVQRLSLEGRGSCIGPKISLDNHSSRVAGCAVRRMFGARVRAATPGDSFRATSG